MVLSFRNSFFRDWNSIDNRALNVELEKLFIKVKDSSSPSGIHRMKKLKGYSNKYKVELRVHTKIYWVLCEVNNSQVEFYRVKSESWCKRNLRY